ncbi:MAG: hypothetical protein ACI4S4_06010 [Candidatus Ornithospirochaeta sp.]
MRKFVVVFLALSVLLSSCASTDGGDKSAGKEATEREKSAVELLSIDMFSSLSSFSIPNSDLAPALPYSYIVYESYVPSFDHLEDSYLSSVAFIAEKAISEYMPVLRNIALEKAEEPLAYIAGDTSLSDELKEEYMSFLVSLIEDAFIKESDVIEEAFSISEKVFSEIRIGYRNLGNVGKGEDLPVAEGIDYSEAARLAATAFFLTLGNSERVLKNTPASADSPYSVFWE